METGRNILKPRAHRYDEQRVTSCPACALPSPAGRSLCAYCSTPVLKSGPSLSRLVKTGNDHALLVDEKILAVAEERTQWKSIRVSGGAEYSLVSFTDAGGGDGLLLDEANNIVASISAAQGAIPPKLHDGADELLAVVRTDGCGGLHALRPNGDVLFYLGRSSVSPSVTDVLMTDAGLALPLISQFALMVSLTTQHSHLFSA